MNEHVDRVMAFLERCDSHISLTPLMTDFSSLLSVFGFEYFMMTRLPAMGEDAEPYIIAHSWPDEWLRRYRERKYFWHDPVSAFSLAKTRPFSWKEARCDTQRTATNRQLESEATSLGLVDGLGFPMGDPRSVQAVVSLASNTVVDLAAVSRHMLHLACLHAELRAVELHEANETTFAQLTEREREVLRWIANGKSYDDTGQILSISERTVKQHLTHSRQKLNASTTTHAVAKAMKGRQIFL